MTERLDVTIDAGVDGSHEYLVDLQSARMVMNPHPGRLQIDQVFVLSLIHISEPTRPY